MLNKISYQLNEISINNSYLHGTEEHKCGIKEYLQNI